MGAAPSNFPPGQSGSQGLCYEECRDDFFGYGRYSAVELPTSVWGINTNFCLMDHRANGGALLNNTCKPGSSFFGDSVYSAECIASQAGSPGIRRRKAVGEGADLGAAFPVSAGAQVAAAIRRAVRRGRLG